MPWHKQGEYVLHQGLQAHLRVLSQLGLPRLVEHTVQDLPLILHADRAWPGRRRGPGNAIGVEGGYAYVTLADPFGQGSSLTAADWTWLTISI